MRRTLIAAVLAVCAAGPARAQDLSELRVDVLEDAQPIRDVLARLEAAHGLNYVVSEQVLAQAGTVTVRLRNVPLDTALAAICSACGLNLEIRGSVLVILPKEPGQRPLLPEVHEGLDTRPRPQPAPVLEEAPPRPKEEDLSQAVGTLHSVDLEQGRLTLQMDGVRRDFYLPEPGGDDPRRQAERLRSSIVTLKPGERIALLYRRHATHPVVTDLVGGAYPGGAPETGARPRPRRPKPEATGRIEVKGPASREAAPAPPEAAPEQDGQEGFLAGTYLGHEGEEVRIKLADGSVSVCVLPQGEDEATGERRQRLLKTLDELAEGKKIGVTYKIQAGRRALQDTITEAN